jgi:GH35 family endo-1,4-beta-xylanase
MKLKSTIRYCFFTYWILSSFSYHSFAQQSTLKDAFKGKFYMGTALSREQFLGFNTRAKEIVKMHFNAIVAENCMKSMYLQPEEGKFFFEDSDKFVEFGENNNMYITGHTLIWHSQIPRWFFEDESGNDVSSEILIERMKQHIHAVVGRYKGKIKGWDVVNEAILDNGEWRDSKFYQIIGKEFVNLAFQFAHEADPDAELYYNDYSMALEGRRNGVVKMVKSLQEQGIRIDGIGMQGHVDMDSPSIEDFEKSIIDFSNLGVKVMITELDLSALPSPWSNMGANISDIAEYQEKIDSYSNGVIPRDAERKWEERYLDFFRLFLKHQDKITRVTLWGISDANSWKNDFPIRGRTDYPLLFDRNYDAKPIVQKLIEQATHQNGCSMKTPVYLVPDDYMADPAVHVFEDRLYIYPSHDRESGIPENDSGDHFDMNDYHAFSMEDINGEITDHGVVLKVEDIAWAGRKLWDCDVAFKTGRYYMYFPLKDKTDIFRIGVAVSDKPYGPFIPEKRPVPGSYSIDPAIFEENGQHYMYFGGIWGGQLQRYRNNKALESAVLPADNEPALCSKVVRLSDDMLEFAEEPRDVVILDETGKPLTQGDTERRFFEASWMHKYKGKYYYSYSTGDTHLLCYAIGDNPYGPFTYQGVILTPVVGWTTHHAIAEYKGKWYLFHHDCIPSGGKTWLRSLKVVELEYNEDGTIKTIDGGGH